MAKMSSSAGVFAKRGDPWVTEREGTKGFGRNLETENPDVDQFFYAKKAKEKPVYVDPKPERSAEADFHRRKVNIARKLNKKLSGK